VFGYKCFEILHQPFHTAGCILHSREIANGA
jgi:hypothetical protein